MRSYDAIVIGAGIAGSMIGYELAQRGFSVCVLEQNTIASGASGAAGAFLSPMMGKGNMVNFINSSLEYALNFYAIFAPDLLLKNGAVRYPKSNENIEKFFDDSFTLNIEYRRNADSLFFPNAGMIRAVELCKRLLAKCTVFEHTQIKNISHKNGVWNAENFQAESIVLANGAYPSLITDFYMQMRGVWGERILAHSDQTIDHNLMGDVGISATFSDHTFAVGATHKRAQTIWQIDPNAKDQLLSKAAKLKPDIYSAQILDIKGGMRPASSDYMPIVGRVPNALETLQKFPHIKDGKKIDFDAYSFLPNCYFFGGHASRGFVSAPLTAKILADLITHKTSESANFLTPARFVPRFFRRNQAKITDLQRFAASDIS